MDWSAFKSRAGPKQDLLALELAFVACFAVGVGNATALEYVRVEEGVAISAAAAGCFIHCNVSGNAYVE